MRLYRGYNFYLNVKALSVQTDIVCYRYFDDNRREAISFMLAEKGIRSISEVSVDILNRLISKCEEVIYGNPVQNPQ